MKHIASIIWFLSWPVLIYVTYRVCIIALKMLEKNLTAEGKIEE